MSLFGSSGIRALFSKDLLNTAFRVGLAVGANYHNVVIARDTRTSSDAMKHAVISGLLAAGARCSDAGMMPTPTLAFITREFDAGVMITASHNPPEYNGIKLFNPDGSSFDSLQQLPIEEKILVEKYDVADWGQIKYSEEYKGGIERHINGILTNFPSALNIKVAVDAGCGPASEVTPRLLKKMGCEVVTLNCYPSGFFPRGIEPVAANLTELCNLVKESGAALGIAHDGDADRIGAMDERGNFVDPHKIMALSLQYLAENRGWNEPVIRTVSTTRMIDRLAGFYGLQVYETPVGFNHIAERMLKEEILIGGEESGGISFKGHIPEGDGVLMGLLLVEIVAKSRVTLHELVQNLLKKVGPAYYERKDMRLSHPVSKTQMTQRLLEDAPVSIGGESVTSLQAIDGVKYILADDSWLLIRPSGTEPVLRVYAEGRSQEMVNALLEYGEKITDRNA